MKLAHIEDIRNEVYCAHQQTPVDTTRHRLHGLCHIDNAPLTMGKKELAPKMTYARTFCTKLCYM